MQDLAVGLSTSQMEELLYAKWVDPIGACFVAYEAVRRGAREKAGLAARNLAEYFPFLPDGAALAALTGIATAPPRGVPLFLDGLRAFPDYADWLPLPAGYLDFAGPWTAWRGAV